MSDSVEYIGHCIDVSGLHTLASKVKAVQEAPQPRNVQQLYFLGLLHYYGKFLPNLATFVHPLNALLTLKAHGNADGLSRLSLGTRYAASADSIFAIRQIQALPVTAEQIATTTWQDAVLS